MSSWTDEDKDGDTCASSPTLLSTGGRQEKVLSWSGAGHGCPCLTFMGLGHSMNPIPYPPQLNFPPPPIMAPIPLGAPPPPYPMLPPPVAAPAAPAPVTTQAAAPMAWANVVNTPAPTAQASGGPPWASSSPCSGCGGHTKPYTTSTPRICSRQRFCS